MTSLTRYYLFFGGVYIALAFVLIMAAIALKMSPGGIAVMVPFLVALLTAQRFVRHERRAPTYAERNALALRCFGVLMLLNIVWVGFGYVRFRASGLTMSDVPSNAYPMVAIFIIAYAGLAYTMMWWAYGWLIRKQADKIMKG